MEENRSVKYVFAKPPKRTVEVMLSNEKSTGRVRIFKLEKSVAHFY